MAAGKYTATLKYEDSVDEAEAGGFGSEITEILKGSTGVGGMAVPLEKVSPRTFMPRHDCPPGHWCLGMNVPSRHYCPPMPDIFS